MLDKLNQIAQMVQDAINAHPDNAKKRPADPDADQDSDESAAEKAQKSIRKNTGGQ